MTELVLQPWNISKIADDSIIIMLGMRGSGKTQLAWSIMYEMRNRLHSGIAFTPTLDTAKELMRHMPASFIYDDMVPDALDAIQTTKTTIQSSSGGEEADKRHVFLFADDCMYDKKHFTSVPVRKLFQNGRHPKCMFINLTQYICDLSPALRTNITYLVVFADTNQGNRITIHKNYFAMLTYEEFESVFEEATRGRRALVLDRTIRSTAENKYANVFYTELRRDWIVDGKPVIPEFKIGAPSWWIFDRCYAIKTSVGSDAIKKELNVAKNQAIGIEEEEATEDGFAGPIDVKKKKKRTTDKHGGERVKKMVVKALDPPAPD